MVIEPAAFRSFSSAATFLVTVSLFQTLSFFQAAPAAAECSPVHRGRALNPDGHVFKIVPEGRGMAPDADAIAAGVGMWERTCRRDAFGPEGNIRIRIRFHAGANDLEGCGAGCGCTIVNTLPAPGGGEYVSSAIIHLFEHYRDGGGDCRSHRAESIAHDLGHALGLRDLEDPYAESCYGRIMSYTSLRSVEAEDCRLLEELWRTLPPREGPSGAGETRPAARRGPGRDPRAR